MDAERMQRLSARIGKVRKMMKEEGIDAFLVRKKENKYYLSMFRSTSYDIIITEDRNYLVTDFRYAEAASGLEPLFSIEQTYAGRSLFDILSEKAFNVIGLEFMDATVFFYNQLAEKLPEIRIQACDGKIESIRAVKDREELECTRQAEHIGDLAFEYILGEIRPGVSENEIALKLELKMRELGASGLSFDTICVSGVRTSMPHGEPTDKLIESGDLVTMDFGCIYEGYCSDMTRTVGVGHLSDKQRSVYCKVLEAQQAAIEAVRAGVRASDVDRAARDIIDAAGYRGCFGHGLGHGTGLEIHEAPTANPSSSEILKENMLLTIEPGIYIPGEFGVRIEDLSIVREDGIINLTESNKELIIL